MTPIAPPLIRFRGTTWTSETLTAMALGWRAALAATVAGQAGPLALVMTNHPRSVALFFALSSFPNPLVLLPADLRPWRSEPPLPAGTRVVLLPEQRDLEADGAGCGVDVTVLGEPEAQPEPPAASGPAPFMQMAGLVLFTSGSTGVPRPVYRATPSLVEVARALVAGVGLARGDGVIAALPLSRAFGFNHGLMAAAVLGSPLVLLDRFDHRATLRLFESGQYRYWAGTAVMADVLGRAAEGAPPAAAPFCLVGGRIPADVARRFEQRFGVRLRQVYGTTETGSITVDGGPSALVRSATAGRPVAGVTLHIGDDPRAPLPAGTPGRVWISAPHHMMAGYGFPPRLEPPETIDGWWASPDVGALDGTGALTLLGRVDDCFRTGAGHMVSPVAVSVALEGFPGVVDAAVVPLPSAAGSVLGVLVEGRGPLSASGLRAHLAAALPAWSQPRVVETTAALPRLASGRTDRRACIAILGRSLGAEAGG